MTGLFLHAQEWSEFLVINPSQSQPGLAQPCFWIDYNANIHCVLCTNHSIKWNWLDEGWNACKPGIYLISLSVNRKITRQLKTIKN
jgi:hypothetical protein